MGHTAHGVRRPGRTRSGRTTTQVLDGALAPLRPAPTARREAAAVTAHGIDTITQPTPRSAA
ncbi:hypothetical protein ABZ601_27245 [Streptomyces sp. NPDC012842]|uniref:hypothetical protein n=1 Tax=Streptomyces TaxID=1883 RepID=UPI0033C7040B